MVLISIILTAALAFDGPDLLTITKHYEGFKAHPYLCPAGVWTIGYGHTEGVSRNSPPVSKTEAEQLLIEDLTEATVGGRTVALPGLTKRRKTEAHYFRTGKVLLF